MNIRLGVCVLLFCTFLRVNGKCVNTNGCSCTDDNEFMCSNLTTFPLLFPVNTKHITFTDMMLDELPANSFQNLPRLQTIDIRLSRINRISTSAFRGLRNIEYVNFVDDEIAVIETNAFQNLSNFGSISFYKCTVSTIQEFAFSDFQDFEDFSLFSGTFTTIDTNAFHNFHNIMNIDFSDNEVGAMKPRAYSKFSKVETFAMFMNNFGTFGCENVESMLEVAQYGSFYSNDFQCDCALSWLIGNTKLSKQLSSNSCKFKNSKKSKDLLKLSRSSITCTYTDWNGCSDSNFILTNIRQKVLDRTSGYPKLSSSTELPTVYSGMLQKATIVRKGRNNIYKQNSGMPTQSTMASPATRKHSRTTAVRTSGMLTPIASIATTKHIRTIGTLGAGISTQSSVASLLTTKHSRTTGTRATGISTQSSVASLPTTKHSRTTGTRAAGISTQSSVASLPTTKHSRTSDARSTQNKGAFNDAVPFSKSIEQDVAPHVARSESSPSNERNDFNTKGMIITRQTTHPIETTNPERIVSSNILEDNMLHAGVTADDHISSVPTAKSYTKLNLKAAGSPNAIKPALLANKSTDASSRYFDNKLRTISRKYSVNNSVEISSLQKSDNTHIIRLVQESENSVGNHPVHKSLTEGTSTKVTTQMTITNISLKSSDSNEQHHAERVNVVSYNVATCVQASALFYCVCIVVVLNISKLMFL